MTTRRLPVHGGHQTGFAATQRTDGWWVGPLATFLGLTAFVVYANWALFQAAHYYADPYLSPFYSPVLLTYTEAPGAAPVEHAWIGRWPEWWPAAIPPSPAILILIFPLAFRFTCYYYRKAYYRAFTGSPPACAVGPMAAGKRTYRGERAWLVFQNLHRYALYFALAYIVILYYDALVAFRRDGEWGIGVGSVVLLLNATFLAGYTFGCHSFRHLIGGHDDCMSCGQATLKHGVWKKASWLNQRHMFFAWLSLFWVGFTDVYVRLVSMGVITDLNTWN